MTWPKRYADETNGQAVHDESLAEHCQVKWDRVRPALRGWIVRYVSTGTQDLDLRMKVRGPEQSVMSFVQDRFSHRAN